MTRNIGPFINFSNQLQQSRTAKQLVSRAAVPYPESKTANISSVEALNLRQETDKPPTCEDTFFTVAYVIISKEQPATFQKCPALPSTSHQILVFDVVADNSFHVGEPMTNLVLKTVKAQDDGVDNSLSAFLESLIERFVKTVLNSPETVSHITKAAINNPEHFTSTAPSTCRNDASEPTRKRRLKNAADNMTRLEWGPTSLPSRARQKLVKTAHWYFRRPQNEP